MKPEALARIAYEAFYEGVPNVKPFDELEPDSAGVTTRASWARAAQAVYNKGVVVGSRVVGFKQYPSIPILREDSPIFGAKEVLGFEKLHGCVPHTTRVSLADGSSKAISALSEGDSLLGVDGGGKVTLSEVTRVFRNGKAEKWLKITGKRRGLGRGNHRFALTCTPEHHVWHASKRRYVTAGELEAGDTISMLRSELGLTPIQEQVLLGKMLGDGSLNSNGVSAHVSWGHRAPDLEYARWTSRALGDLDSGTEDERVSGYGSQMFRRRTVNNSYILDILGSFMSSDVKRVPEWVASCLTPLALAFWYMDDGSLAHTEGQEDRASFAVCGFNEADCSVLVAALARLGIEAIFRPDTEGYSRLYLNSDAAESLFLLVAPYIPPCMQRKLPPRYRGHEGWLPSSENTYKPMLVDQVVESVEEDRVIKSQRYDIETTTHNYFANGVLVHNSNFRIGFPLGMSHLDEVRYGSREVDFEPGVKFPLPHAITWCKSRPELLAKMWEVLKSYGFNEVVVFGEFYGPGCPAKGIKYAVDGDQNPLFRAFDIMVGDNFLTYDLFKEVADKMELPQAPLVYRGPPSMEAFNALLNKPSIAAKENGVEDDKNLAEGVVFRTNPLMRDVFGDWLIAKHKGAKFSEVAHAPAVKKERVETPADRFAAMYVTEGRVVNALGRLRDRGVELKGTMQDTPVVLAEVLADLHKECQADWPDGVDDKGMTGPVSRVMGPVLRGVLTP